VDDHRCDKSIEPFAARFRGPADEGRYYRADFNLPR
jgi:hypothetical protein